MTERYCYLRDEKLDELLADEQVLDALIRQLKVTGKTATLKSLSNDEKFGYILEKIDYERQSTASLWYKMTQREVLAATIFRSEILPKTKVSKAFNAVKREIDLREPLKAWLDEQGFEVYAEVPMGTNIADVVGYKKGSLIWGETLVAIESKNELDQFKRGPDQLLVYQNYAHRVYLACTPYFAAEQVNKHGDARTTKHWNPWILDNKLRGIGCGCGLLLVEGRNVDVYVESNRSKPNPQNLAEVKTQLRSKLRI